TDQETAALPPDAQPTTGTCASLPRSNVYILPSHYLSPDFSDFVDQKAPEGESPSLAAWWKSFANTDLHNPPAAVPTHARTRGAYRWACLDLDQNGRFLPSDNKGAALERMLYLPSSSAHPSEINNFIAGNLNLLLNVPFNERANLRDLGKADARNFQIA